MDCRDCARYDLEGRRCLDRKLNPKRYSEAVEIANVLGLRPICVFNDHREKLVRARALQVRVDPGELCDGNH